MGARERLKSFAAIIYKSGTTIRSEHGLVARSERDQDGPYLHPRTHRYNKLVGSLRHLALRLSTLPAEDPFRAKNEQQLLAKLYEMGLLDTGAKMSDIMEKVTVSAFCRRRLPVLMCRLRMSETVKQAVTYVEQGQVRVGTDVITDPAYMVTRNLEDL